MKRSVLIVSLALIVGLASCSEPALTVKEMARYQKILDMGHAPMKVKEPVLAAGLNLLCGAGYFYLEDWGHGFVGLLLTPISWIWGIPAGYTDARRMNIRYTLEYYKKVEVEDADKE